MILKDELFGLQIAKTRLILLKRAKVLLSWTAAVDASENDHFPTDLVISTKALQTEWPTYQQTNGKRGRKTTYEFNDFNDVVMEWKNEKNVFWYVKV